jgi:hypothetical protein
MNIEINITKELISMGLFLFSFMCGVMFYQFTSTCECGSWWHTDEERKSALIYLTIFFIISIIISVIGYKLNWFYN